MSIQEQRRAAFEAHYPDVNLERNSHRPEFYLHLPTRMLWEAWNAALDGVVIELPGKLDDKPYACYEGGWNDALLEAGDRIEAAGLKVAP